MAEGRLLQIVASLDILQEIHRVLEYEKILRILRRSGREPSAIMAHVVSLCSLVDVKSTVRVISEDPLDNRVLACAKDVAAHFIVSGDRHLLKLGEFEHIRILTASNFLETLPTHPVEASGGWLGTKLSRKELKASAERQARNDVANRAKRRRQL